MISASVKLNEVLIQYLRADSKASIITAGIRLGGWVTNLHRGMFNSSTSYVPLMAGTFFGELLKEHIFEVFEIVNQNIIVYNKKKKLWIM